MQDSLDGILSASRYEACDIAPPVAASPVRLHKGSLLPAAPWLCLDAGTQVVVPTLTALWAEDWTHVHAMCETLTWCHVCA